MEGKDIFKVTKRFLNGQKYIYELKISNKYNSTDSVDAKTAILLARYHHWTDDEWLNG